MVTITKTLILLVSCLLSFNLNSELKASQKSVHENGMLLLQTIEEAKNFVAEDAPLVAFLASVEQQSETDTTKKIADLTLLFENVKPNTKSFDPTSLALATVLYQDYLKKYSTCMEQVSNLYRRWSPNNRTTEARISSCQMGNRNIVKLIEVASKFFSNRPEKSNTSYNLMAIMIPALILTHDIDAADAYFQKKSRISKGTTPLDHFIQAEISRLQNQRQESEVIYRELIKGTGTVALWANLRLSEALFYRNQINLSFKYATNLLNKKSTDPMLDFWTTNHILRIAQKHWNPVQIIRQLAHMKRNSLADRAAIVAFYQNKTKSAQASLIEYSLRAQASVGSFAILLDRFRYSYKNPVSAKHQVALYLKTLEQSLAVQKLSSAQSIGIATSIGAIANLLVLSYAEKIQRQLKLEESANAKLFLKLLDQYEDQSQGPQILLFTRKVKSEIARKFGFYKLANQNLKLLLENQNIPQQQRDQITETLLDNNKRLFFAELSTFAKTLYKGESFRGEGLSEDAKYFLETCNFISLQVGQSPKVQMQCDYDKARVYKHYGMLADLEKQLWIIIHKYPASAVAKEAGLALIHGARDKPEQLALISDKLLKISDFQTGELGKLVRSSRRKAMLNAIRLTPNPFERANRLYMFAGAYQHFEMGKEAMLEAARSFQENGYLTLSLKVFRNLIEVSEKHRRDYTINLQTAKLAQKLLNFDLASYYLDRAKQLARTPSQLTRVTALSCRVHLATNIDLATNSCKNVPEYHQRLIAELSAQDHAEKLDDFVHQNVMQNDKFTPSEKITALARVYDAYNSINSNAREAKREQLYQLYSTHANSLSPEARRSMAKLAYNSVSDNLQNFESIYLTGNRDDEFLDSVRTKKQAIDELEKLYQRVLKTQDARWGVKALTDLSKANFDFANQLASPPEIEGVQSADLIKQLSGQVSSLKSKAKSLAASATSNMKKFNVLSESNRLILNHSLEIRDKETRFDDWVSEAYYVPNLKGAEQ